ncbi:MAG: FtsH protease activity modulator HflK [Isosphaeraceae bacterium]
MTARRAGMFVAGVALAGYLATGLKVVQQDERGVVRRFGAATTEPYMPGLHLGLPWGMEQVDRVKVDQARTISVGARGLQVAPLSRAPDPSSDDFLTGDLNVVTAEALVQFRLKDAKAYLFTSASADAELSALAESALAGELAGRGIDDVLTSGRAEVSERLQRKLQTLADARGLGVSVVAVRLARVAPPSAVAPAFADAAKARGDKRQAVTRAEEYRDRARADARGQAQETADRAAGRHETLVQAARGEADRFGKLVAEVRKSPKAARRRLYLETIAEMLPRFKRTVVVPSDREIDLSVFTDGQAPKPEPAAGPRP